MFSDASSAMVGGFMLSQDRYFYIREDTETGASHGVIHGRTGSSPVTIYKTAKAVVIGIGKPDAITGKIAVAVCKIGDSLSSFGLWGEGFEEGHTKKRRKMTCNREIVKKKKVEFQGFEAKKLKVKRKKLREKN